MKKTSNEGLKQYTPRMGALDTLKIGLPVIPVHGIKDQKCTCGYPNCDRPGKHPILKDYLSNTLTTAQQVSKWFDDHPHSNYGIVLGGEYCAIDLDMRPGIDGVKSFTEWTRTNLKTPITTLATVSGNKAGGGHQIFRLGERKFGRKISILEGVDAFGEGCYLVGPGSWHASGGQYCWATKPSRDIIATMPPELHKLIENAPNGAGDYSSTQELNQKSQKSDFAGATSRSINVNIHNSHIIFNATFERAGDIKFSQSELARQGV